MTDKLVSFNDIRPTLALLSTFPREFQRDARKTVRDEVAKPMAQTIAQAASGQGSHAAVVSRSIRPVSDRIPSIRAGGSRRATRNGATAGDLFFGAEFGGGVGRFTKQFRPHQGRRGYFFYPTLRNNSRRINTAWLSSLDGVLRKWGTG
jgi:hypothetical protein